MQPGAAPVNADLMPNTSPLRLVKLRLSLSLVAMAVLPLAIAAPLAYSILDGEQAADRIRAERDATALAAAIGTRIERTTQAVVGTASGTSLAGYLVNPPKTSSATARATLLTLATSTDDAVADVMVQDADGDVRIWITGGKVASGDPRLPDDDPVLAGALNLGEATAWTSPVTTPPGGTPMITIAAPVPALSGGDAGGIVRVNVSLASVVTSAAASLLDKGASAQLQTQAGAVVAQTRAAGATAAGNGTTGAATVPSLRQWRVRVSEPSQSPQTPVVLLAGLAIIGLAIAALTIWMARQIIRPADELEASRQRLRGMYQTAREDALRDALTGLGNYRAFHEEFERQVDQARRYSTSLALALIDLDDFKLVNETAGHAAGDDLLAELGRLTVSAIRAADRAFRIGGDEFAILMPHTDAEGARVVGRRVLAHALETRSSSRVPNSFSLSVGISSIPAFTADRRQLYGQADSALHWAKAHGRTMVEVFDPERHRTLAPRIVGRELAASVAELTARRALRPVYQPIVELRTGRVIGYEGLVRPAPDSGFANAGELFAAAEGSGRQVELDQTCLDVVVAGAASLTSEMILSLNLSPRSLEAPEFSVAGLVRLLERYGIAPSRVILELTERETVDDLERLRHNVSIARTAGFRVAADDVGAGNAGLRLLSQMQFDIVKIDLTLVQGGPHQTTSLAVIGSLQELAQRWGAWVIAEGVETPEQLGTIRNLGISAAQGYLLGRPGDSLEVGAVDISSLLATVQPPAKLVRSANPFVTETPRLAGGA